MGRETSVVGRPVSPSSAATAWPATRAAPRDLLDEVRLAERLGLGSVFLSERFNVKDAARPGRRRRGRERARIGIGTAATNHNTRHPLVTATMATTLHRLTGGRYALGLGRGFDLLFDVMGVPRVTGAQIEDAIGHLPPALARRGGAGPRRPGRARSPTSTRTARSTRTSRC